MTKAIQPYTSVAEERDALRAALLALEAESWLEEEFTNSEFLAAAKKLARVALARKSADDACLPVSAISPGDLATVEPEPEQA